MSMVWFCLIISEIFISQIIDLPEIIFTMKEIIFSIMHKQKKIHKRSSLD